MRSALVWQRARMFEIVAVTKPSSDVADAVAHLKAATAIGAADLSVDRQRVLDLIASHPYIGMRTCRPGHLTGSAFVVDPERQACLLMFHTKLQRWLQPGGHADGDMNLANVALREAQEETGIDGLRVVVPAVDIDIHSVDPPTEDAHLHLDVRFLVLAPAGANEIGNHESEALRWVREGELAEFDLDENTLRMATSAFAVARMIGDA